MSANTPSAQPPDEAARTAALRSPRRRVPRALAVLALALVLLALGARAIVGQLAADALRAHGLVCVPVTLDPGWTLATAEVGATSCTVADTRVTGVGLPYGASIALGGGLTPRAADVPEVTAEIGGEMDLGNVGTSLLDGTVPEPMQALFAALARASSRPDLPRLAVGVVRVRRAAVTLVARSISVTREGDAVQITVAELDLPLHHGPLADLELAIESIEVRATAREVTLDARLVLDARVGRREIDSVVPFHVAGTGLDGETPTFTLAVEGIDLGAIRERIDALGARRERGGGDNVGGALERVGEIADRLGALRARMAERSSAGTTPGAGTSATTESDATLAAPPETGTESERGAMPEPAGPTAGPDPEAARGTPTAGPGAGLDRGTPGP